ncbi:phage tail assembly protein [Serratia marcescens]|uniref:phage tail assembly protein n=2 Tax=Serratia TaxID=613 RepID=UPI0006602737
MQFTETGTLDYGVQYNGKIHRDFEIRLQTVGDEIDVGDEIGSDLVDVNFTVHLLARTLLRLGSIPAEDISPQLLRDNLVYEDYNALLRASGRAKKKLMPMSQEEKTSGSAASSSESTDLPNQTSEISPL